MFLIKYLFLLFSFLQIIITTINCLNQNDLCKRRINEKRCQILNETVIQCISDITDINECASKSEWKMKCGHSYCSKDTLSCEIFKMRMDKVEEKEKKIKKDWKDKLIIRNYLNFKNEIKNCPRNNKKNETFKWKLSDVCDNQNKFDCNGGRLSHKCIDLFCVSDNKVCMGFTSLLSDFSFDIKKMTNKHQIKKCLPNRKFL
jgi:hypothetical protein